MSSPKIRKNTNLRYEPAKGTKRYYFIQSLRQGGTAKQIRKRAIELAARDGHEFTPHDFRDMRISWLLTFLRQRGAAVLLERNKVRVFS
jgi:integrase